MNVILKVTLSLGHALTLYSLSNLTLSVGIMWAKLGNKIGYQFTRPAEFYCDKTWFHEEDEQQWRCSQGKSKTGETPVQFSHKTFQHIEFSLVHTKHWYGYGNGNTYVWKLLLVLLLKLVHYTCFFPNLTFWF
jgi:hypothetical protein